MKDIKLNEFLKVVERAGFKDENNRPDYERILIVLATGLIQGARVYWEKEEYGVAIQFERRANRIEDYLRDNGYFDFD